MSGSAWKMGCLLLLAVAASAPGQDAIPFNAREFEIPIRILPSKQSSIERLELFFSTDRGKTWQRGPQARPTESNFAFTAKSEGEHWFCVLVVDKQGKRQPADPYSAPIGQKILIDTLKPDVQIISATRESRDEESVRIRWKIQEEHPNISSLKLQYQKQRSGNWITVSNVNQILSGEHVVRAGPEALSFRLTMQDTAENAGSAEASVEQVTRDIASAPHGGRVPPPPGSGTSMPPMPPGISPSGGREEASTSLVPPPGSGIARSEAAIPPPAPVHTSVPSAVESPAALATSIPAAAPTTPRSGWDQPSVPVVRTTRVTMEYEVARYGPSGLGGADLYISRDDGQTWQLHSDVQNSPARAGDFNVPTDSTLKRTISVSLRDEGLYGFYLVVKSGAGLSKPAPRPGTPPHMRMILDTTMPKAALYPVQVHPQQTNALILRWQATDKHLVSQPISLQWAAQATGPWETIGQQNMANTGSYLWQVPTNTPARVYLRLTVKDQAGNVAVAQTREPILIDLQMPEVKSLKLVR